LSDPIGRMLDRQPAVILDGGLATDLETRGAVLDEQLWSAGHLVSDPQLIEAVHRGYLEAGADCVVSASYQATLEGFAAWGLDSGQAEAAVTRSVELARSARDAFVADADLESERARPLVAASVGPYGAYLADGSEYTGDYGLDEDGLLAFHRDRWELLATSGADLLACETVPSLVEARALARLLAHTPWVHAWVSFSCRDEHSISDGSDLAEAIEAVASRPEVVAVGVNCTPPRYLSPLLERARATTDKPLVAYPNSGERWDAEGHCWKEGERPVDLATAAVEWHRLGARLIGGCCRTGPDDIRALRRRLIG
jgi:homocysteine S-methyltransferase